MLRPWVITVIVVGLIAGLAPRHSGAAERLPVTAEPERYDLKLHPDAQALTFTAEVDITLRVVSPTPVLVLNEAGLTFDSVSLDGLKPLRMVTQTKLERVQLRFAHAVLAGEHRLRIAYHGSIAKSTLGFFAMDYQSTSGPRRTLATNFEPAAERKLMPSWDEPSFKAVFAVSVDAPRRSMAIGNMPIVSETPLASGMKRVTFAPTPKMASYLLFIGVGDFERISGNVDGVEVGVVVAQGDAERGRYALQQAQRLLHYYNEYFGVRYPLPKLDLVAAPGEIEGGSMENWGAIFYSQQHLLFDPRSSTDEDRRLVFEVVAHEMAHQWFGDLVTMRWWDNLWLNEGFARWMETKAADDLQPEWHTGLRAAAIMEQGMTADAEVSTHPVEQPVDSAADAELAFDEITYDKGAAVIGMLERYLGADKFRNGVAAYMQAHAYGNSVSEDLWNALQAAAGKPVWDIARGFTRRAGLPMLAVEEDGTTQQSRFFKDSERQKPLPAEAPWHIPLAYERLAGAPSSTVLTDSSARLEVAGTQPLLMNVGRTSYVRVLYTQAAFDALAARFSALAPVDQMGLLFDAEALGKSQYAPLTRWLVLVQNTPVDDDPLVWRSIARQLEVLDRSYNGLAAQSAYRAWARQRLAPLAARLGWTAAPGEIPNTDSLREVVLEDLGRFGDPQVIAEARRRYAQSAAEAQSQDASAARIAREITARTADAPTFERMAAELRATIDPLLKKTLWQALDDVADPALAQRLLEMSIGPDAPAGSFPGNWFDVSVDHPELAWRFAIAHVDAPGFPLARSMRMVLMPGLLDTSADPQSAEQLRVYAAAHLPRESAHRVAAAIAGIGFNARLRSVQLAMLDSWLKNAPLP